MRDRMFADREFTGGLRKLALPIGFQSLMLAAVGAADALMLGNLEQNAMSAVSLATQIQFVQNIILSTIVAAAGVLGAQYWGKQDNNTVSRVLGLSLRLAVLVSLVFAAACVVCPGMLMAVFTNEETLIRIGSDYLRLAGWSYLFSAVSQCILAALKVTGNAGKTAMISTAVVLVNILLNAVFIFGLPGFEPMGAVGAALATLLSRILEMVWAILALRRRKVLPVSFSALMQRDQALTASFRKCALPLLGAGLFWGVGITAYPAFIGHLGADAAAANAVASVLLNLVCCFCKGIANGGGILLGNVLGAGKLEKGRLYGQRLLRLSLLCGLLSALLVLAAAPLALRSVRLSSDAAALLRQMLWILAFYMVARSIDTVTINGVFAAGGDTMFDFYSLAVCMWGIAVPLAAAGTFWFHWPAPLVYACTCLDEVGKIPWVLIHFRKYRWVRDLTQKEAGV